MAENIKPRAWRNYVTGVFLALLALTPPELFSFDARSMLAMAESLVLRHNLTVPPEMGQAGRNGAIYSHWYPLISWVATPMVWAAEKAATHLHLPGHYIAAVAGIMVSEAITALAAGAIALLALRVGARQGPALAAGLAFAFGTMAFAYARSFFAEPLLALLLALAAYGALGDSPLDGWMRDAASFFAVWAKPTGGVTGFLVAATLWARGRRGWPVAAPMLASLLAVSGYAAYSIYHFGHASGMGQATGMCAACAPAGIPGLLFSPGFGLAWFAPACWLAILPLLRLARRRAPEVVMLAGPLLAFVVIYSVVVTQGAGSWSAGWSWGPRYLVPALPGLLAAAALGACRTRRLLIAMALGAAMLLPTVAAEYAVVFQSAMARGRLSAMAWHMSESPLLQIWPQSAAVIGRARHTSPATVVAAAGSGSNSAVEGRAGEVVNLWWWVLPGLRISRWAGAAAMLLLLACGGWLVRDSFLSPDMSGG